MALERRMLGRLPSAATGSGDPVLVTAGLTPYTGPGGDRMAHMGIGWLEALDDMATTIEAEDTFDLASCASPIAAPTLLVAGRDDRFYAPELFEETARLIPGCDLRVLDGKGHITALADARCRDAVESWL